MEKTNTRLGLLGASIVALALAATGTGCGDDGTTTDGGIDSGTGDADLDGGLDSGAHDAAADGGADGSADAGDGGTPPACDEAALGHFAVVTTAADYSRAALSAMRVSDWTAPAPTDLMDTDAVADQSGCQGYVLERGRGIVDVLDPSSPPTILRSIDLNPAGSAVPYAVNQQHIAAVGPSRAYVTELGRNVVSIIDPGLAGAAAVVGQIDLSPYLKPGDADGLVDAVDVIAVGDRAYVALGNYWFDSSFVSQFEGSELAVIDTTTDTLVDVDAGTDGVQGIPLLGQNPWRGLYHDAAAGTLWVGATGDSFAIDGHIEEVDLASMTSVGIVVAESDLGGEIMAFGVVSPTRLAVLVGTDVVAFDPSVDFIAPTPFASEMDGMIVHGGTVWAWARSGDAPGLASFDGATGAETTPASGRVNFGELPISSVVPVP